MHARLRLDLRWSDLAYATVAGLTARADAGSVRRLEQLFSPHDDGFAALSVRSGFDLYLRSLALPRGSEVLVSGLTIPHMVQILEVHGLHAVPFELDPATLGPRAGELERRSSPSTRAVLFAHLFGARASLGDALGLARRNGWLFWEDCAQAFAGDGWRGEPDSDLALFSFGLIKTATAIQGGLLRVKDADVRERMRALQAELPVQGRADFLRRTFKAGVLLALSGPRTFALFARACRWRGVELDEVLHAATRGFPGADFLERLRRAPSAPLIAMLERRLRSPHASLAGERRALGERLLAGLGPSARVHGRAARERHHWVFALPSAEPAQLVRALRAAGFDATARSSLIPVAPTAGGIAPEGSRALLASLVYVPLPVRLAARDEAGLVRLLRADASVFELAPGAARPAALQPPGG